MALKINKAKTEDKEMKASENKDAPDPKSINVVPGKRLYLTSDRKRLVEGGAEAAILYCTEYDEVNREEYEGLIRGD